MQPTGFYAQHGKRMLDIAAALLALPVVGAASLLVGTAIKLDDGGPVLFKQTRRGLHGRTFAILKFRSMAVNAPDLRNPDSSTLASASDPRLTQVGRVIRRLSVDELPQVINVLIGDMSLVGPRPNLATKELSQLKGDELLRLSVRPGITGFNQAYYRNSSSLAERYANDCKYAGSVTLMNDIRIIFATLGSVVRARNIYSAGGDR